MHMDEEILRCTCGGGHFISIGRFPDENQLWFTVEDEYRDGFWRRLKNAWTVLRGKRHSSAEVALELPHAQRLVAELQRHVDAIVALEQSAS